MAIQISKYPVFGHILYPPMFATDCVLNYKEIVFIYSRCVAITNFTFANECLISEKENLCLTYSVTVKRVFNRVLRVIVEYRPHVGERSITLFSSIFFVIHAVNANKGKSCIA